MRRLPLSQTGVFDICQRFDAKGETGLISGKRGRKPDEQRLLDAAQEAEIRRLICRHMPDELGLEFALRSRTAVRVLVVRRFGVPLAVRTTGTYLARWGFTAQKPLRRARAVIFWGDETGLRADDVRGRSYALCGKTPVVRPNHRRMKLGLISAVANRGELRWKVLDGAIKAPVLICFLQRLIRDAGRKVFLILDRLRMHRSAAVREWLARHKTKIEVSYLPSYCPEP